MVTSNAKRFFFEAAVTALVVLALGVLMLYVVDPDRFQPRPSVSLRESDSPITPVAAGVGDGAVSYANAVAAAAPAVVNVFTAKVVPQKRHPFMDDPFARRFGGDDGQSPPSKRL